MPGNIDGASDAWASDVSTIEQTTRAPEALDGSRSDPVSVPSGIQQAFTSTSADALGAGSVIAERFEIVQELGRGGFGTVYEALDLKLPPMRVAIKTLNAARADERGAALFRSEAQLVARLEHPSIVKLHDYGIYRDLPYLAFEHIPGETLEARIRRQGRLDLREALPIAIAIGKALVHAHKLQIIHRDIKPANVLLTEDGHVKLLDFGLGRLLQDLDDGVRTGTRGYAPPEQWDGRGAEPRSDIFSAAVTLRCSLTGMPTETRTRRWPFGRSTRATIWNTGAPRSLMRLIRSATAEDLRRRPASAQVWVKGLEKTKRNMQLMRAFVFGMLGWLSLVCGSVFIVTSVQLYNGAISPHQAGYRMGQTTVTLLVLIFVAWSMLRLRRSHSTIYRNTVASFCFVLLATSLLSRRSDNPPVADTPEKEKEWQSGFNDGCREKLSASQCDCLQRSMQQAGLKPAQLDELMNGKGAATARTAETLFRIALSCTAGG